MCACQPKGALQKEISALVYKDQRLGYAKTTQGNSIPSSVRVTKKLTQQYVGTFLILERVGCLAYKLDVPSNKKIYPVFSIAQLELAAALASNFFHRLRLLQPSSVFMDGNTDVFKSFEIHRLLNKRTIKKKKG